MALQVFINGVKKVKTINVSVRPENYDEIKGTIKSRDKESQDLQLILENVKAKATKIITEYRLREVRLTVDKFMELYEERTSNTDFLLFYKAEMDKRLENDVISKSTYIQNKTTLEKLKRFKGTIHFSDIDTKFLQEFDNWHHHELIKSSNISGKSLINDGINTRWHALKNVRTYVNLAIHEGLNIKNPFLKFKIQKAKAEKVFLIEEEVQRLVDLYNSNSLPLYQNRHLMRFMISVFTGLRVSDSRNVTNYSIVDNHLIFIPKKTRRMGKSIKLPLNDTERHFIEELRKDTYYKPVSDQDFNRELKKIMPFAGITKNVTSHVGRHSFAYLFLASGGRVEVLMELIGHSDIKTTMEYVHITNKIKQEQMNNMDGGIKLKATA